MYSWVGTNNLLLLVVSINYIALSAEKKSQGHKWQNPLEIRKHYISQLEFISVGYFIATPSHVRARGTRIVGAGTRLSVVMSSRFFSVKNATFSSFLMRMVSHLVFTMKTTVTTNHTVGHFTSLSYAATLPRRKEAALHKISYCD